MSTPRAVVRKRSYGVWLLVVLLVSGGLYAAVKISRDAENSRRAGEVAVKIPERTHIYALGRLEPAGTILELTPESGNEGTTVGQLLVEEGDDVEAGQKLAVLDNQARRQAALQEAVARLDAAEARLAQVRAGARAGDIEAQEAVVRLAESQSRVAAKELERAVDLLQKKAITGEQLDLKQWEFDRLQLEQQRASGVLKGLKEIRMVDVRVAEKDVAAAQAAVERSKTEADSSELKAPQSGRILRIHTRPGERVSERGILELGDVRRMQAVAEVFEGDIRLVKAGLPAEVFFDGSDERLFGHVLEVGNLVARKIVLTNDPVSDTDARVVEVRIALDDSCLNQVARLSNARVEVRIQLPTNDTEAPSDSLSKKSAETAGSGQDRRAEAVKTVSERRSE